MKLRCSNQKDRALTLVEALVVIVLLLFLVVLILPSFAPTHHVYSKRINCVNNLKQLGLAYRIWAGDNNGRYPMEISVTNGGTLELVNTSDAWKTFQVMSNELSTPKILFCPEDSRRKVYATNFGDDLKNNISYFIGLDANTNFPQALLSGDDNFEVNNFPVNSGVLNIKSNTPVQWDTSRQVHTASWFSKAHDPRGNLLLGDGSVQMLSNPGLSHQILQTGLATNRIVIP